MTVAQNVTIENEECQLTIDLSGAIITGFSLKDNPINPIHKFGHFLAFDRWGPSEDANIPFHGNGAKIKWTLLQESMEKDNYFYAEMTGTLPIVKLKMNRKVFMDKNVSVVRIVEEITNENDVDKVFNLVQHATIGQPFLDESTVVDTKVNEGFSQEDVITSPLATEDLIGWPQATVDGQDRDLRFLTNEVGNGQAVVTYILDKNNDYGWITALNASQGLLIGYLWPIAEYPWLNLWQRVQRDEPEARGLEFGTTGLHQVWSVLLERGTLLDEPIYETIGAKDTIVKSYLMFLTPIPNDFLGVENVLFENDQIKIDEYGLDPERAIVLTLNSILTTTESDLDDQNLNGVSLSQNYPNPFSESTTINYHLPDQGFVILEIFDFTGKKVRTVVNKNQSSGIHSVSIHSHEFVSGKYTYRLEVDKKDVLVKEFSIIK